jgi:hypothetical protein
MILAEDVVEASFPIPQVKVNLCATLDSHNAMYAGATKRAGPSSSLNYKYKCSYP